MRVKTFGILPLLFTLMTLHVSCNQVRLSDARDQYINGEYYSAAETYRKLYRQTRNRSELRGVIAYEMAEVNRKLNRTSRAIAAYSNAIRYNYPDTLMYLRYAQMLHREGRYEDAISAYKHYLEFESSNKLALNGLQGASESLLYKDEESPFEISAVELFNSSGSQYCPMINDTEDAVYFTSSRNSSTGDVISGITGTKYSDIYVSRKNAFGEMQIPELLRSEVNSDFDEGAVSFSSDGMTMLYTYSYADLVESTNPKIYISNKVDGVWTVGRKLKIVDDDSDYTFAHPSISSDSRYVYFTSDMPGGYGGMDIWRASINNMYEVLSVENLGEVVNGPGNEMFPYIKDDGRLYFSSDGHPGRGGLDIFIAKYDAGSNEWNIENMGYPFNSPTDDFGITFERGGNNGYFSSNRGDERGFDKIYRFEKPELSMRVEGLVVDQNDDFIEGATVSVVSDDGEQYTFVTNKMGAYDFKAEANKRYVFMASADGFINNKQFLQTDAALIDTLYYVDFEMIPYNEPVVLDYIFYDFDSANLREESTEELDDLVSLMSEHPEINVELMSHTDRIGDKQYNYELSERRAESVLSYLVGKGIRRDRLTSKGYGMEMPKTVTKKLAEQFDFLTVGDVLTSEFIDKLDIDQQQIADQINRRTEFKVLLP
ncbi:MAG: OmpA family protein [Fermentimonas sp.]|jgi:peptidoglycan-associated lipoprotein